MDELEKKTDCDDPKHRDAVYCIQCTDRDIDILEGERDEMNKQRQGIIIEKYTLLEQLRQMELRVGELQKKLEFMADLGRKSMENFDDDLEERPMRHSLGKLHRQWEVVLGVIEKLKCEGLQLGESRNLPYPKPISDDDAKKPVASSPKCVDGKDHNYEPGEHEIICCKCQQRR